MKCPFCGDRDLKVTDSREAMDNAIRRRRECGCCGVRFTTFETIDISLQVKKRDGTYQDFCEDKLIRGLDAACRYTRISHDQVRDLAHAIKADLLGRGIREIESQQLGDMVMARLQKTDVVAYIRFACVYKRFQELQELIDAIQSIGEEASAAKNVLGSAVC
jgi:transcriptional repressor NrdR